MPGGSSMTRWSPVADASPGKRLRRCPQSYRGACRRRPAEDGALPGMAGAVVGAGVARWLSAGVPVALSRIRPLRLVEMVPQLQRASHVTALFFFFF